MLLGRARTVHGAAKEMARCERAQTDYTTPTPPYSRNYSRPNQPLEQIKPRQLPKKAWDYGSPRKYVSPGTYGTPKPYRTPKAYGPGQDSGDGAGGSGNRRFGGGGGGGGGFGGGGFGGDLPKYTAFVFALLVGVGGYMGYKKKGSTASLKASGGVAAVLLLAGILIGGPWHTAGLALALVANLVLGTYMLKGYANTRKIFPQAVFAVLSALNSLLYVKRLTGT